MSEPKSPSRLFPTLDAASWRRAIRRGQEEPNLVLQKINKQLMTNYTVTMDDGHKITVKAWSASDAIQNALGKHIGHRVESCFSGQATLDGSMSGRIDYEIPVHHPLMETPVKRERAFHETETKQNYDARTKPAPWIEEWLAKQKAKNPVG